VPDIGVFHPQIVHFVIGLLVMGVLFRLVSLTGKLAFTGPAAAVMLIAGALAAALAAQSGHEAHDVAERIPGVRQAVTEHEEWGERTRNVFLLVGALEIAALVAGSKRRKIQQGIFIGSAVVGLGGMAVLYETGEHGGALVYEYAGGVGTRSGNPEDVDRLLVAGLYNQAMLDRKEGRHEDAARLLEQLAGRRPDDATARLLVIESRLVDLQDPAGTLAALDSFPVPDSNRVLTYRTGLLRADAYAAAQRPDSARATLEALLSKFPDNPRIKDRLDKLR
jgi:uncharacterized membrane protein